ncbi:phenazine biosynthesis protein phzE [Prauserella shujinwangii]|uniref:anthranilate synthase n=2 Tax=Prauserella shujinwangii TaxID=1453103 RepID=A0A2T0LTB8_9PSEU|nr:phenazine biosynthesis protein phzE [Prauserella shujinwangii]
MAGSRDGARTTNDDLLDRILCGDAPEFAVLYRPEAHGESTVEVMAGSSEPVGAIRDLLDARPGAGAGTDGGVRHDVLAMIPYRQVRERGFECRDDRSPIVALRVEEQDAVPRDELVRKLPDTEIRLRDTGFDVTDDEYSKIVEQVLTEEIGRGAGSNFVIQRGFVATVEDFGLEQALTLYRRLLSGETGAYWTFLVRTRERTFLGASPERHVTLQFGTATMNPISGTYRYGPEGPTMDDLMAFLADTKESDELRMVVDEELKMMSRVCAPGPRVLGPYLKEMANLAHTEYLIEGDSSLDVARVLRDTMFAPTVVGSPLENAFRVVARHEATGRGYYSGVAALIGTDGAGRQLLDSAILIRTAELANTGKLRLGVGATLVRHSDADSEVAETWAKATGLLRALGRETGRERPLRAPGARPALRDDLRVRSTLRRRNDALARYWFERPRNRYRPEPDLLGMRVVVVDAEDAFTEMLAHQLRSLGLDITVRSHQRQLDAAATAPESLVVVGPGPGDPRDPRDPRIGNLRAVVSRLLANRSPLIAICLGHQVLCTLLGLRVVRRDVPNQGVQREIDLFGTRRTVGFYNTFTAVAATDELRPPDGSDPVAVSRDPHTGEVYGLRGPRLASVQFHPESLLSIDGPAILAELVSHTRAVTPAHSQPQRNHPDESRTGSS